ncbi:MAG: D-tyrosyl-tRNA(Tyr) deacylase [Planctomycetes bacterium]|nr:D-tyrosyl-tRNA(Tyr) deacylase [Planctomycetota bacterium]
MIVVVQRVARAAVAVEGEVVGEIGRGLLLLACGVTNDRDDDVLWLADKIVDLRVFPDLQGLTNLSLSDVGGSALVVSQFTLAADWRKGRRPSFLRAAPPEEGERLVALLAARLSERGVPVSEGRFGAMMEVSLVNDGPFTLVLDGAQRGGSGSSS